MAAMKDPFGRKIDYIRISVTDRCNLRCRYCMPEEGLKLLPHSFLLTYEEIYRIVRIVAGMGFKRVRITGGEPLVRRDIEKLIYKIASVEGIEDVSLTTNGTIFYKFAERLKEAGLKRVNISLDTFRRDRFLWITRRDMLSGVLKSIEKALELGFDPVKINVVLIKGFNSDEVLDFAKFAYENPVTIRFIEYMPTGGELLWGRDSVMYGWEAKEIIEKEYELAQSNDVGGGPAVTYNLVGGKGKVGFITPISCHFCATCNRIRVTSEGGVKPCLFSDLELDIRGPLRNRASDDEIRKIIEKAISLKPRAHKIVKYAFKKCQRTMREIGG